MTKELILDEKIKYAWECDEASPVIPYSDAEKAMDEYAKQQAIAFAINYAKGVLTWGYTKPDDVAADRMEERYDRFIENQFIEQQNKP